MKFSGDPRTDQRYRHRERGPKRYSYTVNDIARLSGLTVGTIRSYGSKVADLEYVLDLIARARVLGRAPR